MESSFMSEALERHDAEEVNVMKGVASTMYAGGSDTVGHSLHNKSAAAKSLLSLYRRWLD